ncbi:MAG: hypothetical protein DMD99_23440 [Candidatus Rokuibacteriota bacterium]|nr:MAG: hypothetical protein DMD99_23440 [Candidatus Rokubacteria bacterium]
MKQSEVAVPRSSARRTREAAERRRVSAANSVASPAAMRAEQGGGWPARVVVGQRRRQRGEHADLREHGDERAGSGEREGPIEGAGRASLGLAPQHHERKHGTSEGDALADEPGCAQPQQDERDHGTPQ